MNVIYIFGIAILLMGGTDSLIEDTKTTKSNQQRILLRKLQNFQDVKPLTWNDVLADLLVNKIRIFSFQNEDKKDVLKNDEPVTNERTVLTNFFSQVFVVYKKFIYDAFVGKRQNDEDYLVNITPQDPKTIENDKRNLDSEVVDKSIEATFSDGPKSEVELEEPKYHGKITLDVSTSSQHPTNDNFDSSKKMHNVPTVKDVVNSEKQNTDTEKFSANPSDTDSVNAAKEDIGNLNKEESVNCAEGYFKSDSGDCVINNSRLILAIPNQCPHGYRKDWLGNCRMVFNF